MKTLLFVSVLFFSASVISQELDDQEWITCINEQADDIALIKEYILSNASGQSYKRLADFVDAHGKRFTGKQELEDSIQSIRDDLAAEFGEENVWLEPVAVPVWTRGFERAFLLEPRENQIDMMGLFGSVSGDVTADVVVVKTWLELELKGIQGELEGKIVVYDQGWSGYSHGYEFRFSGAKRASRHGAVGCLIRSVTDFSIYAPHTGSQEDWEEGDNQIPSGCITTEDAEMLHRMYNESVFGDAPPPRVRIVSESFMQNRSISYNVVAQIVGAEEPDQVIVFGGHIDSWDVGVGAMDDAGGCMITRQILTAVKESKLRPKRTMRLVLWTAEEIGIIGGQEYFNNHSANISDFVMFMESDLGTFDSLGVGLHAADNVTLSIFNYTASQYLSDVGGTDSNISYVKFDGDGTADIDMWIESGVPGVSLTNKNDQYFYFHHTRGDRMTVQDSIAMDHCAVTFAVHAYVIANCSQLLPRANNPVSNSMPIKKTPVEKVQPKIDIPQPVEVQVPVMEEKAIVKEVKPIEKKKRKRPRRLRKGKHDNN